MDQLKQALLKARVITPKSIEAHEKEQERLRKKLEKEQLEKLAKSYEENSSDSCR